MLLQRKCQLAALLSVTYTIRFHVHNQIIFTTSIKICMYPHYTYVILVLQSSSLVIRLTMLKEDTNCLNLFLTVPSDDDMRRSPDTPFQVLIALL